MCSTYMNCIGVAHGGIKYILGTFTLYMYAILLGEHFPIFFVPNPYDSFKNILPEGNTYNEHLLGGTLSRLLHSPI